MPVVLIRTYEARCDGEDCDGEEAWGIGSFLDREPVFEEAVASGWLRRGRKLYCPNCRERYEPKRKSK